MVVYTTIAAVIGQSQVSKKKDWTITDAEVVLSNTYKYRLFSLFSLKLP